MTVGVCGEGAVGHNSGNINIWDAPNSNRCCEAALLSTSLLAIVTTHADVTLTLEYILKKPRLST